jgi:hypothetical protein
MILGVMTLKNRGLFQGFTAIPVWFGLFFGLLFCPQSALSQQENACYQILQDGKDRSAYQYVSRNFLVFSDPSWTTNPIVRKVRLTDLKTRKALPPLSILPANLRSSLEDPWGGVKLVHLPFSQALSLELDGKPAVLKRVPTSGPACPRMDFLLVGRWKDYEVLQQRPNASGTHTVGCHLEIVGDEVLLALPSLENVSVERHKFSKPEAVKFQRYDRQSFLLNYPQLKQRAERYWGITSLYLSFGPLKPGEELKISGDGMGQRVSFCVRRIGEGS